MSIDTIPESTLAIYEKKLNDAGYFIFSYDGSWYYNEVDAGDEDCDGPYTSRAEVLVLACQNLRLIDRAPHAA